MWYCKINENKNHNESMLRRACRVLLVRDISYDRQRGEENPGMVCSKTAMVAGKAG